MFYVNVFEKIGKREIAMKRMALLAMVTFLFACTQADKDAKVTEQAVAEKTAEVAKEAEAAAQSVDQEPSAQNDNTEPKVDTHSAESRVSEDQKY